MKNSRSTRKPNLGAFHVSCWIMGLVAFVQLMSVGVALAVRGKVPEVRTEIRTEYVMVPASDTRPVKVAPPEPPKVPKKKKAVETEVTVEPIDRDREAVANMEVVRVLDEPPPIIDPLVEQLVLEARAARVKGDLYLALAKLSEAEMTDPKNPNILYGLGVNYEEFGSWEEAAPYYVKVYGMGAKAGSLYEKAGLKLAMGSNPDIKDLAMLGWGRMAPPQRVGNSEKRTLVLPVSVAPGKEFDPQKLRPQVRFFEEIDGKIGPAIIKNPTEQSGSQWVTGTADWRDGEEMAEVWYLVPDQDIASGYLFGERKFYGFVAELYYEGRLVDIKAEPRTLLREIKEQPGIKEFQDELDGLDLDLDLELDLDDFGAGDTVLPRMEDDLPELGPVPPAEPEPAGQYGVPSGDPDLPGDEEGLLFDDFGE